jgi:sugar (pentulose or hexulose) kinase
MKKYSTRRSAMEPLVIGIDCSTTACKAIAWDSHGRAIAEGRQDYPLLRPGPKKLEQDADSWWESFCKATRILTAKIDSKAIQGLSITHQRESFVPVDESGNPLYNAILWLDERSTEEVAALNKTIGSEHLLKLTGKVPALTPSLPKLMWLVKHEPEICKRTSKFLDTHAFLIHRLTGNYRTSLPSADPMGIVDMRAGQWSEVLIEEIGLDVDRFPEIYEAGSIIGRVDRTASVETGLPEGLPIAAGAGDGQSAGLGAGVTGPETAYLNLGTAVASGLFSNEYLTSTSFRTLCAPIPGAFYLETLLRSGTHTIDWFISNFAADLKDAGSPESILEKAAEKIPSGCDGLILTPYWNGVMNPYWNPGAAGITLGWKDSTTRDHFYRAILEGIAFEQRFAVENIHEATGRSTAHYIAMGGGSTSDLWCRIVSDITGIPVSRAATPESTCLGAGILAAAAAGWYPDIRGAAAAMTGCADRFKPDACKYDFYSKIYSEVYKHLYPALQKFSDKLQQITAHKIK